MAIKGFPQQENQDKWYFSIYVFTSIFFFLKMFSSYTKPVHYCKQQFSTLNHNIPYSEKKNEFNTKSL